MTTDKSQPSNQDIWVLLDSPTADPGDIARYAGPQKISAEKLAEHLQDFVSSISSALKQVQSVAGEYSLKEITLEAKLSAEVGFVLISKGGVEGAISLKFVKK